MPYRTMLTRTALAAIAAAAVAAPGASAAPADDGRGEAAASAGVPQERAWFDPSAPLPPDALPIAGDDGGGGVDMPVVLLAVAGTIGIAGGMAVAASRVETRTAI